MKRWIAVTVLTLSGAAGVASADDIRPVYGEIDELGDGHYSVRLKRPPEVAQDNAPFIEFPSHCHAVRRDRAATHYACAESLAGSGMRIRYPVSAMANPAILRIRLRSGEIRTITMPDGTGTFVFPFANTVSSVAREYTWLGTLHIGKGPDHLLFVACLIWVAGGWRRIVATISGFTLAHSATLAVSALDLVRIPIPPTEAVIALSVLFLAREVFRGPGQSLTWRYPVAVSSIFGLVHGLGFAAVLTDIGLPQQNILAGLFFFNLGVELGQLAFAVLVVVILNALTRFVQGRKHDYVRFVTAYGVGSVSAYWLVSRLAAFA